MPCFLPIFVGTIKQIDMFEVRKIFDRTEGDVRLTAFETCGQVCSRQIDIETDGEVIKQVRYTGGCNGNLKAIGKLVDGWKAEDIAEKLAGNTCGFRSTSCADQLAKAVMEAKAAEG